MPAFWDPYILALVEAAAPARILEAGTESGDHTDTLLQYCRRTGCLLDVADTPADPQRAALLAHYADSCAFHPLVVLQAIPLLPACDVVLLDTDPNWFTIYRSLQLLFARAGEKGIAPPLVLLHGVGWPFGRRDMYRQPGSIMERHPYARRGMVPGQSALADDGVSGNTFNALHEGGPRNGVLTAAEDFVAAWPQPIRLHILPFVGGLAILLPVARASPALSEAVDRLSGAESLLTMAEALERERALRMAELASCALVLTQRSEALARARTRIATLVAKG